jgi:hypothetical protein
MLHNFSKLYIHPSQGGSTLVRRSPGHAGLGMALDDATPISERATQDCSSGGRRNPSPTPIVEGVYVYAIDHGPQTSLFKPLGRRTHGWRKGPGAIAQGGKITIHWSEGPPGPTVMMAVYCIVQSLVDVQRRGGSSGSAVGVCINIVYLGRMYSRVSCSDELACLSFSTNPLGRAYVQGGAS